MSAVTSVIPGTAIVALKPPREHIPLSVIPQFAYLDLKQVQVSDYSRNSALPTVLAKDHMDPLLNPFPIANNAPIQFTLYDAFECVIRRINFVLNANANNPNLAQWEKMRCCLSRDEMILALANIEDKPPAGPKKQQPPSGWCACTSTITEEEQAPPPMDLYTSGSYRSWMDKVCRALEKQRVIRSYQFSPGWGHLIEV